jgi:hypothetical protein
LLRQVAGILRKYKRISHKHLSSPRYFFEKQESWMIITEEESIKLGILGFDTDALKLDGSETIFLAKVLFKIVNYLEAEQSYQREQNEYSR